MRRRPIILLSCIVLACVFTRPAWSDALNWRLLRTSHFIAYYATGDNSTAERACAIAEKWRPILARKLDFEPEGFVPIYLYPDRRSFAKAIGVQPGDLVVGLAHPRLLDIRVDASGAFEDIARIIPHEMVHVYVSEKVGDNYSHIPVWMHEGLANYLTGNWSIADRELLADAVAGGNILPLKDISDSFPEDAQKRGIAYAEGYSAVSYLAETYSESSLTDLLSQIKDGAPFPIAFQRITGVELGEFEIRWRQSLREQYVSNPWWRYVTEFIWPFTALCAIVAYFVRLMQKRRKAREFEEEDFWDGKV